MTLRPRHPFLFIVALLGACMLWYAVAGQRRERISVRSVKAPVTLVNIPSQLVLVSPAPEPVTVQLRGPLSQTFDSSSPAEVLLDLADAEPGRRSYPIIEADIQVPSHMTVASVDPKEIVLELERLEIALLPVQPTVEGSPAPGYLISSVQIHPPVVRVQGPGSQLAELETVATSAVSIEGATGDIEAVVKLHLARPLQSLHVGPVQLFVGVVPEPSPTPIHEPE